MDRPSFAHDSDAAFVVPAAGFFVDFEVGRGHVHLPDDFAALDTRLQLSILAGWKSGIEKELTRTLVRSFRAMFPDESVALPERLCQFRAHCEKVGAQWPGEFVLALQQH